MIPIDTKAIKLLRDRLLEMGGAPSVLARGAGALEPENPLAGDPEGYALFEAAVEGMVVMLAADGNIAKDERDLLRGAVRELTAGGVRSAEIDRITEVALQRIASEGAERRLEAVGGVLKRETVAAEAAFVLAAAMAFADSQIADEENETLNKFATHLGIEVDRANELLDELQI
jgi:tellurite resistance protein